MNHTKHYQILQDESCHWYRIPNEIADEFTEWRDICPYDLTDEEYEQYDESKYNDYRTNGGPNEVPLFFDNMND